MLSCPSHRVAPPPHVGCGKLRGEKQVLILKCQLGLKIGTADRFFYIKMSTDIMRRRERELHEFLSVNGRQPSKPSQLAEGDFS